MFTRNSQKQFSEVLIRFGQVSLGGNPDGAPKFEEIRFKIDAIPESVTERLIEDDVFSLADSYGDPMAGDPTTFDFLRVKMADGTKKEIEIYNIAIMMFTDNCEETRRLFRIVNSIKGRRR